MAVSNDAASQWAALQNGPASEHAQQQARTPLAVPDYSPHQVLTGGGIPPSGEYVDPTPTVSQPSVEQVPGQSDAHAGTYTLGRKDA